jgi:hypothetical protein
VGAPSGALQLRLLQTVGEVASDNNSTLVMPLPMEVLRFFEQTSGALAATVAGTHPKTAPTTPSPLPTLTPDPPLETAAAEPDRSEGAAVGR